MNTYKFKFKKGFFWKVIKSVGHNLHQDLDRMDVFEEDGSIYSISSWSKYDLFLGIDWVLFTKKKMEKDSGHQISIALEG